MSVLCAARTYATKCVACPWSCQMAVEVIRNHWNPRGTTSWRYETRCYGPKNCASYKAGPTGKAPGRGSETYAEEDWVDEEDTAHRGRDE